VRPKALRRENELRAGEIVETEEKKKPQRPRQTGYRGPRERPRARDAAAHRMAHAQGHAATPCAPEIHEEIRWRVARLGKAISTKKRQPNGLDLSKM
jgi:hypothetical protein